MITICTIAKVFDLLKSLFVDGLKYFEVFEHVLRSLLNRRLDANVMSDFLNTLDQQIFLLLGSCHKQLQQLLPLQLPTLQS